MEYIKELESRELELRRCLSELVVYVENMSYEAVLNMNVLDRNMILNRHNKKADSMK